MVIGIANAGYKFTEKASTQPYKFSELAMVSSSYISTKYNHLSTGYWENNNAK